MTNDYYTHSRELAEVIVRMVWNILGVLATAYAALLIGVFLLQSRLIYFPEIGRESAGKPGPGNWAHSLTATWVTRQRLAHQKFSEIIKFCDNE